MREQCRQCCPLWNGQGDPGRQPGGRGHKRCYKKGQQLRITTCEAHLPVPGVSPHHRLECVLVIHSMHTHTHTHLLTGSRPLHRFPTCSRSLSRLCDLWCRPPRDFNLHRDKRNKRNNLEIRAKEDTFTNPSPKVGWGCHHVICAREEARRGRGRDRELEKAGWGRGSIPPLSSPTAGSQCGGRVNQREEDHRWPLLPSPITTRQHNSIIRNTGQNQDLQRFISAVQRLYLEEGLVWGGGG